MCRSAEQAHPRIDAPALPRLCSIHSAHEQRAMIPIALAQHQKETESEE